MNADTILNEYRDGRRNFQELNLSGLNLSNQDLSGIDLRRSNLDTVNLTNTKLRYADLRGASLQMATLLGVDLTFAKTADANFIGAKHDNGYIEGQHRFDSDLSIDKQENQETVEINVENEELTKIVSTLESENQSLSQKLETSNRSIENLESSLNKTKIEKDKLSQRLSQLELAIQEKHVYIQKSDHNNQDNLEQINNLNLGKQALENQVQILKNQCTKYENKLANYQKEIEVLRQNNSKNLGGKNTTSQQLLALQDKKIYRSQFYSRLAFVTIVIVFSGFSWLIHSELESQRISQNNYSLLVEGTNTKWLSSLQYFKKQLDVADNDNLDIKTMQSLQEYLLQEDLKNLESQKSQLESSNRILNKNLEEKERQLDDQKKKLKDICDLAKSIRRLDFENICP